MTNFQIAESIKKIESGAFSYNTKKLIELYNQRLIAEELDFDFIEHTVKRILLAPSGQVYFEMINGKIV